MSQESVYQCQQQVPINGTISGMVPPGNETGYYYIPIANLPWQTSWQELKDHVRTVCPVERVEISEDSTSGHVVLKGCANFDAAFRLLNGGIFHDRALIADGRNAYSWVLIKHQVNGSAYLTRFAKAPDGAGSFHKSTPSLMEQSAPNYGEWSATPVSPSYMTSPVADYPSSFAPYTMSDHAVSALIYGMTSCTLEQSPTSSVQHQAGPALVQSSTASLRYKSSNTKKHPKPHSDTVTRKGGNYVTPKRRKIVIRQLQPWVDEAQLRELIRQSSGSASQSLQELDVPLADIKKGAICGYAFATFNSKEVADKVIKRLHNYRYEGRVLEVKHMKEGVPDYQMPQRPRFYLPHRSHNTPRQHHDDRNRKGKGTESLTKTTSSGHKGSNSISSGSDVIIAHGSSLSRL
ncbi:hypothetical protein F4808DRAFT_204417 [Astrocystis sublimbata]|nr:hypothetical protein F4808DRAFT_204417 [Astrocystis sublimbata]